MKPWIGCEIRLLRTRLGWSRTQLARFLGCSPLKIVKMESDEVIPLHGEKGKLEALSMELEEHFGLFQRQTYAEAYMAEAGVEQVHLDEIDETTFFPKKADI